MNIDHDADGVSLDLSPEEAEALTLFLAGHARDPKEATVAALRTALVEYVNPRQTYHARVAAAREASGDNGKRLHTEERLAINDLLDLAKRWPASLELFFHEGVIHVLRVKAAVALWPLTPGDLKRITLATIDSIRSKGNEA